MPEYTYETLTELEKELVYSSFSRADAFTLGTYIDEESKKYGYPVSMEITINGLVVYRYFQDGCPAHSTNWLQFKKNVIESQGIGSLRFGMRLEKEGSTLEDNKLDPAVHAPGGGGMPILIRETGMIGSVCVSGCPNHLYDQLIVENAMRRLLQDKQ